MVRIGINKESNQKVAIKILTKKDMSIKEHELVNNEIEILKVCQHPNIVRIYYFSICYLLLFITL